MESEPRNKISRRSLLQVLFSSSVLASTIPYQAKAEERHDLQNSLPNEVPIPSGKLDDAFVSTMKGEPLIIGSGIETGWEKMDHEEFVDLQLKFDTGTSHFSRWVTFSIVNNNRAPGDFRQAARMAIETQTPVDFTRPNGTWKLQGQEWYSELPEIEKFSTPGGSTVENITELVSKDQSGASVFFHEPENDAYALSPFADGTVRLLSEPIKEAVRYGYTIAFIDYAKVQRLNGLDYSQWAQAAFQNHLDGLSETKLAHLGLQERDIQEYDVVRHIKNLDLKDNEPPAVDPIYREFLLEQHKAIKAQMESITKEVRSSDLPKNSVEFYGNGFKGDELRNTPSLLHIHDAFDLVFIEDTPTVPPDFIRDFVYKFGLAAGHFEKPVILHRSMWEGYGAYQGLDPEKRYNTLLKLQVAEAYANGCRKPPNLTGGSGSTHREKVINNWVRKDGTVPDELIEFVEFLQAHERILDGITPKNDVAVIYSLPTVLWHQAPEWDWQPEDHLDSFRGASKFLQKKGYSYDVLIFGHDELWNDSEQLERLTDYEAVLLPNATVISQEQVRALAKAMDSGTSLIVSGDLPSRNADYQEVDFSDELVHEESIVFKDDLAYVSLHSNSPSQLTNAVEQVVEKTVTLPKDVDIGVTISEHPTKAKTIVNLVNYQYDPESDSVSNHTELPVRITQDSVTGVRYYSQNTQEKLEIASEGEEIKLTIPSLDIWGFLVINHSDQQSSSSVSKGSAQQAITEGQVAIRNARENGHTTHLNRASLHLKKANAYFDLQSFAKAKEKTGEAVKAAERAFQAPSIGIHIGHTENEFQIEVPQELSEEFPELEVESFERISSTQLERYDIIFLPPAMPWKGKQYGFDSKEIDHIEQYVETGGNLVVIAKGDIDPDINLVLERFGMEADLDPLQNDEGNVMAETIIHPLSKFARALDMNNGTPLNNVPSELEILAEVREGTNSIEHKSTESAVSGGNSTAINPVFGVRPYELGTVTYYGNATLLRSVQYEDTPEQELIWNMIDVFGRLKDGSPKLNQSQGRNQTSTTQNQSEISSNVSESDSTRENLGSNSEASGFGITSAIASIVGTLYVLKEVIKK